MAMETQERTQLVNDLLERVGQTVGERAHVSTIFGEAVEREGVTVIPVAKARFGCGGGGGSGSRECDEGSGGGGGGGVAVGPIGDIEVRDRGAEVPPRGAEFKPISRPTDTPALAAAASLPVLPVKRLLD